MFFLPRISSLVMQYVDRVLALIENFVTVQRPMDGASGARPAAILAGTEAAVMRTLRTGTAFLISACHGDVYDQVARKIIRFCQSSLPDADVGGPAYITLLFELVVEDPSMVWRQMWPSLKSSVFQLMTEAAREDVHEENAELLWTTMQLTALTGSRCCELLAAEEDIILLFESSMQLQNERNFLGALRVFTAMFSGLTHSTLPFGESREKRQSMSVHEWFEQFGNTLDMNEYKMKSFWSHPKPEHLEFAQRLFDRFLGFALDRLERYANGLDVLEGETDSRKQKQALLFALCTVDKLLVGVTFRLPFFEEADSKDDSERGLERHADKLFRMGYLVGDGGRHLTFRGLHARQHVYSIVTRVEARLLTEHEDLIGCLERITDIYYLLLFHRGYDVDAHTNQLQMWAQLKRCTSNRIIGYKKLPRPLHRLRIVAQHMKFVGESHKDSRFSSTHAAVIRDVFALSVSRYSQVRKSAQALLWFIMSEYAESWRLIMDPLLECLRPDADEHKLQAAFYIICPSDIQRSASSIFKNKTHADFVPKVLRGLGNIQSLALTSETCWKPISVLLPALLETYQHPSISKPTIATKMEATFQRIGESFYYPPMPSRMPSAVVEICRSGLSVGRSSADNENVTEKQLTAEVEKRVAKWKRCHAGVFATSMRYADVTHPVYREYALQLMTLFIRKEQPVPLDVVKTLLDAGISEVIAERDIAIPAIRALLEVYRPRGRAVLYKDFDQPSPDEWIRLFQFGRAPKADAGGPDTFGRDDPERDKRIFTLDKLPQTEEDYTNLRPDTKAWLGFNAWPPRTKTFDPSQLQQRSRDEMDEVELAILDRFLDNSYVEKFVKFCFIELEKFQQFCTVTAAMYHALFRNYQSLPLKHLRPRIEQLLADDTFEQRASSQRCAAEIVSGLVSATKKWPYNQVEDLTEWLAPLLRRRVLNILNDETRDHWENCFDSFAKNGGHDPHLFGWIHRLLLDDPLRADGGNYAAACRIRLIEHWFWQFEWRTAELMPKVAADFEPHLSHQNRLIRESVAEMHRAFYALFYLVDGEPDGLLGRLSDELKPLLPMLAAAVSDGNDTASVGGSPAKNLSSLCSSASHSQAQLQELLTSCSDSVSIDEKLTAKLQSLVTKSQPANAGFTEGETPVPLEETESPQLPASNGEELALSVAERDDEKQRLLRLARSAVTIVAHSWRIYWPHRTSLFDFLPLICQLVHYRSSPDIVQLSQIAQLYLSNLQLTPPMIGAFLDRIESMLVSSGSWRVRVTALKMLQTSMYRNFFPVAMPSGDLDESSAQDRVRKLIVDRLIDKKVEVREEASRTMSGLLQCRFFEMDNRLMLEFEEQLQTFRRVDKEQRYANERSMAFLRRILTTDPMLLLERHAGVLGVSAYVLAYPYDVPDMMPRALMSLSRHAGDPQPISATVKKTFENFWRTHQDQWHEHKAQFSADELSTLTGLLVSPNYYA